MDITVNRKRTRGTYRPRTVRIKTAGGYSGTRPANVTVVTNRRTRLAPFRTGGFFGLWNGRRATELKTIDNNSAPISSNIPNTGNISLLSGVAAGTDYNQRIGRKIMLKSILLRLNIQPVSTTSQPVGDAVRIIVFYDTQTNGAIPLVADVLQSANYTSPLNLNNRDRFKVIMDKYLGTEAAVYTAGALTSGSPKVRALTKYRKCGLEAIYSGTGATVGSIATGGIFILYISQANNVNNIQIDSRIRFMDN